MINSPTSSETRRGRSPLRSTISSPASLLSSPPRRFSSPRRRSDVYSDRFIPSRVGSQLDTALLAQLEGEKKEEHIAMPHNSVMHTMIRSELLGQNLDCDVGTFMETSPARTSNIFRYKASMDSAANTGVSSNSSSPSRGQYARSHSLPALSPATRVSYDTPGGSRRSRRKISRVPFKVLDAPSLQDDFYLNLVDWSASNVLAVGLSNGVYLWSAFTSKVTKLNDFAQTGESSEDSVTSVAWMSGGAHLAIGLNSGGIQIWDAANCMKIRDMHPHAGRVGALAWSMQSSLLASGSRDRLIMIQDARIKGNTAPASSLRTPYCDYASTSVKSTPPKMSSRSHWASSSMETSPSRTLLQSHVYHSPQRIMEQEVLGHVIPCPSDYMADTCGPNQDICSLVEGTNYSTIPRSSRPPLPPRLSPSIGSGQRSLADRTQHDISSGREWDRYGSSVLDADSSDDSSFDSYQGVPMVPQPEIEKDMSAWLTREFATETSQSIDHSASPISETLCEDIDHEDSGDNDDNDDIGDDDIVNGGPDVASNDSVARANDLHSNVAPSSHQSSPECVIREFGAHKQEVCGLKWSFDEKQLASGGNDNKLYVWNMAGTGPDDSNRRAGVASPEHRFSSHTAAVKAIAWSPHQSGLLASGGGTADRNIRFWNTHTGAALQAVDTGSQVCNLMWSTHVNEIVSTHGYSLNQIAIWKYPSMQKLATLTGHTYRVLYLAMSPDGQSIVTGAGDETLRFWNVFPGPKQSFGAVAMGSRGLMLAGGSNIR